MKNPLFVAPLLFAVACSTVDQERSALKGALVSADVLADEVHSWTIGLERSEVIPESAVKTVASFQERADKIAEEIDDASSEAAAGVDLSGVLQALAELEEFDAESLTSATQPARSSLLAQFRRHAESVKDASIRAASRLQTGA